MRWILQEKTKEEKESELIPKISSALNFGLAVIDSDFIKLELDPNDSDSDDDDVVLGAESLLEPKVVTFGGPNLTLCGELSRKQIFKQNFLEILISVA